MADKPMPAIKESISMFCFRVYTIPVVPSPNIILFSPACIETIVVAGLAMGEGGVST